MLTNELRGLLTQNSRKAEMLSDGILRVYDNDSAGRPYAVRLFDCTEKIMASDFDIAQYQEEWLRKEYFRVSSSLQWNTYCYFMCQDSAYEQLLKKNLISLIESNMNYARKYVSTLAKLQKEFKERDANIVGPKSDLLPDLASEWSNKLINERLSVLSDDLDYSITVTKVLEGEGLGRPEFVERQEKKIIPIPRISSLKLSREYRLAPDIKDFNLADCTLISGVNATGKTSLLEAIELWYCGKNRRNPGDQSPIECISIKFVNTENGNAGCSEWVSGPVKSPTIYRDRALSWYGNYEKKQNVLYRSFGRYNFYDSDIAVRLELEEDTEGIDEGIRNMFIGSDAARLKERLSRILPQLQSEQKRYKSNISKNELDKRQYQEELQSLKAPTAASLDSLKEVSIGLKSIGWTEDCLSSPGIVAVFHVIQTIASKIADVLDDVAWISSPTKLAIEEELNGKEQLYVETENILQTIYDSENKYRLKIDEYQQQALHLERYAEYMQNDALKLTVLQLGIDKMNSQLEVLEKAESENINLSLLTLFNDSISVAKACEQANITYNVAVEKLLESESALRIIEKQSGRSAALLAEICSKAVELIEYGDEQCLCPLCKMKYSKTELVKRITADDNHFSDKALNNARKDYSRFEKDYKDIVTTHTEYNKLRSVTIILGLSVNIPLSDAISALRALPKEINVIRHDLATAIANVVRLSLLGFTATELDNLKSTIANIYGQQLPTDPDQIKLKRSEIIGSIVAEQTNIEKSADIQNKAIANKSQLIKDIVEWPVQYDNLHKYISNLRMKIEGLNQLDAQIIIQDDINLRTYYDKLKTVSEIISTHIKLEEQNQYRLKIVTQNELKLKSVVSEINAERPILNRINHAIEVIEDILNNKSTEKYLDNILSNSRKDIVDIFKCIHAPRVFSDINIAANGTFTLLRQIDGKEYKVSQISSGQRSALCLAIFLGLNRCAIKAPPILLFDDPVAHVDDLNVLSFFDFLRDMVMRQQRQIIYTTANQKMASLFKKKFDFMDAKGFCHHSLCASNLN